MRFIGKLKSKFYLLIRLENNDWQIFMPKTFWLTFRIFYHFIRIRARVIFINVI